MPYYAVARGKTTGVFMNWKECQEQVNGFTGAAFKKFNTIEEAEKFVSEGGKHIPLTSRPSPYIKPDKKSGGAKTDGASSNSKSTKPPSKSAKSATTKSDSDSEETKQEDFSRFVDVFTDGCCLMNGRKGARAGFGVHWPKGQTADVAEKLTERPTNNHAEIRAACRALQQAHELGLTHVRINTDSQFMIDCMTKWVGGWQKKGWKTAQGKPVVNADELKELLDQQSRVPHVQWQHVEAHVGIEANERADELAKQGAMM